MTTLYDIPTKKHNEEYYDSSDSEEHEEVAYEMDEFDLDVVDDALLNPNSSEYMDHFGFKIQVRTDDESSSDDDSNFDESDRIPPTAATTVTTTSDDDSIDVATPHHQQHIDFNHTKREYQPASTTTEVPILKSPPTPKPESKQQRSGTDTRSSNESRHSILSTFNNPFKRPASVVSVQSPSVAVPRPSQSFQQRQSKRYSEAPQHMIGLRSPESNHRHFDKLVSKFRRFSHNDHHYDSEKHGLLQQEALAELQIYREKGGIENNIYDWGKYQMYIYKKIFTDRLIIRLLDHCYSRFRNCD